MRIFAPEDFDTQPWKNGSGVTHEIAREDHGAGLLWRLSIAEVGTDGPFSAFPGLARVLTVIEGAGLHLHTPEGRLDALPLAPVAFSGDTPVRSRLIDGPVRDFNVIYDPAWLSAHVEQPPMGRSDYPLAPGHFYACLALASGVSVDGVTLPTLGVAQFEAGHVECPAGIAALLVRFAPS
ncbi:HutD family protein [Albidovulum sediminicola]|uniref:HutD family protein n=1 Tax=Albidovulum sediminicola TaxID=2984331 RepID=A0ABT2Z354_9RHOB|nr:HutD family protein [Defluviimonas sp. WL0075]MCV2865551.1 HutD family protein [Defluviimonas sp. WL0075]